MVDVFKPASWWVRYFTDKPKIVLTNALQGIETAIAKGAKVINVSIGFNDWKSSSHEERIKNRQRFRASLTPAINSAKRNDSLIIFAASNGGEKCDNILLPSDSKDDGDSWLTYALRVAATDQNKKDADWSDLGDTVNIAAPGSQIGWGNGNVGDGTSYAAPLTSGVAALVKSLNLTLSAPEIRYILLDTATSSVLFSDDAIKQGATGPKLLLNAINSVNSAKLTTGVSLRTLSEISLLKDATTDVTFPITVPPASVSSLDVLFLIDTTGSYGDDIDTLQAKAEEIINNLSGRGIDVQFGVASFADFPFNPYGDASSGDKAFYLNQSITGNTDAVINAINQLDNPLHWGYDEPESQLEALYQCATGMGRDLSGDGNFTDPGELRPANIGWRTGSLKIILFATDAPFHDPDKETYYGANFTQTIDALKAKGIKVMGLQSGSMAQTSVDMKRITDATDGSLYALSSNSGEIADKIAQGITEALKEVKLGIQKISEGRWVTNISPEAYTSVKPGETRNFTITLKGRKNKTNMIQSYNVYLWIKADDSAIVKRVRIPVIVPSY